jgi:type I restriction enzyme, S subunit
MRPMRSQNYGGLILQLAVRGKLVPQDANDEPAYILLEKIQEEKNRLIKEKIIKNNKVLTSERNDNQSYVLPNGWTRCFPRKPQRQSS